MFALFGTAILFVQMCLSFFMGGGHADVDMGDGDADASFSDHHMDSGAGDFRLFSIRSIVAFLAFFGWGGVIAYDHGVKGIAAFVIALSCGSLMMFVTALILYFVMRMQHSGNITDEEYLGCSGTVYLRIPSGRREIGKVTVTVAGTTREIVAVSDDELPRGTSVRVVEKIDGRRFLVEKI
jgi:membrane protein implicated in regulation of membrane protease activity